MCSFVVAWCIEWQEVQVTSFCRWNEFEALMCSEPGPWHPSHPCIACPPRVSSMVFQCGDFSKLVVMSSWQLWQVADSVEASAGASTCLPWLRGVAELGFA